MTEADSFIIETPRLILRHLTLDDLDALAVLYCDPEVRRYFPEGDKGVLTYAETKEELEWVINVYYRKYGYGLWATIDKATGAFIGRCGLIPWTVEGQAVVEVAYLLAKDYWGRGLGTEAAQAILNYGFERLRLARLVCFIDPENIASQKVAQHIGMTLEKETIMDGLPTLVYAAPNPKAGG